ncbi:MAG TPA: ATP-binding cassette domain-containing protein [Clostridia bacterium]|nr:MAG: Taurine import ATP-binding protein TauB [Firmicutes bacterium ADurb.Bin356]HOR12357.1 ATP-binding cassette domain-containing protein [Clostridia bacterium]
MSIRLKNVHADYEGKAIFTDFSLELPAHGALAVLGPSGSGKTTLLRLLAGLITPQKGAVEGLVGKTISMVFQENRLLPWCTSYENIALVQKKRLACPQTLAWLERMELAAWRDSYPNELSGGMQRRVALGRACAFGGDILLLDEPFTGIDEALRERLVPHIKSAAELIVLVTHDSEEAELFKAEKLVLDAV